MKNNDYDTNVLECGQIQFYYVLNYKIILYIGSFYGILLQKYTYLSSFNTFYFWIINVQNIFGAESG